MAARAAGAPKLDGHHDPSFLKEVRFEAMTTEVGIWLISDHPGAQGAMTRARRWIQALERRLSRFLPDSELSRLNAAAGTGPQPISPLLRRVLGTALDLAERTGGLVVPTLAGALARAGFGPGPTSGSPGRGELLLRDARAELPPGVGLDLGGVAKGWAADRLALALAHYGPVLVDLGGDLRCAGPLAWPVGVEGLPLQNFYLLNSGVATSSILKRRRGDGRHHLMDPRTGLPADTDLAAATVVAPTAALAEGAAKTALILGSKAGREWLEKEGFSGVLVRKEASA